MRVSIDPDRCTGHGRCYGVAPDVFDPDDEGRGVVVAAHIPSSLEDQARLAEANCPERAIRLTA